MIEFYATRGIVNPMERILAVAAVAGMVGVIVFGGYAMHPTDSHAFGCIASSVLGVLGCPTDGAMAALFSHLDALRVFSTVVVGAGLAMMVGAFALVFSYAAALVAEREFFARAFRGTASVAIPIYLRDSAWLSLHENSPALFGGAGV